jgi:TolB-like protein
MIAAVSRWVAHSGTALYASVAVLPFSVEGVQSAYLADGVVEAVINGLTRLRDLRVSPRASAFRFKDALGDPVAAGRALDAAAVVTGSLAQSGDGFRLQVDLVDVARNAQVWSKAYEVALADLPKLEARVLEDLAGALHVPLSTGTDGSA